MDGVNEFGKVLSEAIASGWANSSGLPWTYAALAKRLKINRRTLYYWTQGKCKPHNAGLESILELWRLSPHHRQRLVHAWLGREPEEMEKRAFLKNLSVVTLAPTHLTGVVHTADRYQQLRELVESGEMTPHRTRMAIGAQLLDSCYRSVKESASRTNHMLAALTGSHVAIISRRMVPEQSLQTAQTAIEHADLSGYRVAQLWSRTALALVLRELDRHVDAVGALQGAVFAFPPERGTMGVFAAAVHAESVARVNGPVATELRYIHEARDRVFRSDEFGGRMIFPVEQQLAHSARTLLNAGDYPNAIKVAAQSLEILENQEAPRIGYMRDTSTTIAQASAKLYWLDIAEEYALKAIAYQQSKGEPNKDLRNLGHQLADELPYISEQILATQAA